MATGILVRYLVVSCVIHHCPFCYGVIGSKCSIEGYMHGHE
jgi:hypothetical protein